MDSFSCNYPNCKMSSEPDLKADSSSGRFNILKPAPVQTQQDQTLEFECSQCTMYAEMIAGLLCAPIAHVSLLDRCSNVRIIASYEDGSARVQLTRVHNEDGQQQEQCFDVHVIHSKSGLLIVKDALLDLRFRALPEVTGAPRIRFYAGAALVNSEGYNIGTIGVLDTQPRPQGLCEEEIMILQEVASEVMLHMQNNECHKERTSKNLQQNMSQPPLKSASSMPDMLCAAHSCSVAAAPSKLAQPIVGTTDIRSFLGGLELVIDIVCKSVNVFLHVEQTMPDQLVMAELAAFRSAAVILTSALERTKSGYIVLRLSLQQREEEQGHVYFVFECEDTAPAIDESLCNPFAPPHHVPNFEEENSCFAYDQATERIVSKPKCISTVSSCRPHLEAVARNMDTVGGSYGIRRRETSDDQANITAPNGSVVWFSLPVRISPFMTL